MRPFIAECQELIIKVRSELALNERDWERNFRKYLKRVLNAKYLINIHKIIDCLGDYLSLTVSFSDIDKNCIRVRYLGQMIAMINIRSNGIYMSTVNKTREENNERHFDCNIVLRNELWGSEKVKNFLTHFKGLPKRDNEIVTSHKVEEDRLEDLIVYRFRKDSQNSSSGFFPVNISGITFKFHTPIKGSGHNKGNYISSGPSHVDILARYRSNDADEERLCIIELKDENVPNEPVEMVVQQALVYAVFIRELLRSESGELWWRFFGFDTPLPEKLVLIAASMMPDVSAEYSSSNVDEVFGGYQLHLEEGSDDVIELHYIYFNKEENGVGVTKMSL